MEGSRWLPFFLLCGPGAGNSRWVWMDGTQHGGRAHSQGPHHISVLGTPSGFFLGVFPLLAILAGGVAHVASFVACVIGSLLLVVAGVILPYRPLAGRWLGTVATVVGVLSVFPKWMGSPATALAILGFVALGLGFLWRWAHPQRSLETHDPAANVRRLRAQALTSFFVWLFAAVSVREVGALVSVMLTAAVVLSYVLGLLWFWEERARWRARALGVWLLVTLALAVARPTLWASTSTLAMALPALVFLPSHSVSSRPDWLTSLLGYPERLFVATFGALCTAGTLLLVLPASAADGRSIGLVDAAFTAVSAVCVTGLIVVDTPVAFSPVGQLFLLLLIQLGGLGIMTFSTAAMRMLGRRLPLRHEMAVARILGSAAGGIFDAARRILIVTLVGEAAGALVLTGLFWIAGDSFWMGLWRGLFTAVSAFCNAGFALQSDSLIGYNRNPLVLYTTAVLIVLGGLSPAAVVSLALWPKNRLRSVQFRLAFVMTAALLLLGFGLFASLEWNGALGGLGPFDRLHNAFFQSVTLRTAGFNSVDFTDLRPATHMFMLVWMFVGGSPGGTAGGIKTTTLAVLILAVVNVVRGTWRIEVFHRRVPDRTILKAGAVSTLGLVTVGLSVLALLITQGQPTASLVFEAVSAFGTVGLSLGATAGLDGLGKAIVMGTMFAGRVGSVTLLMFVAERTVQRAVQRPVEDVDVG